MPTDAKHSDPGVVAGAPRPLYTAEVGVEGTVTPIPWWKDAVRSWAPVLGFAVLLVFQMVSFQQQVGELRTDLHREIGGLREDLRGEIGVLGERIARLEALMERIDGAVSRSGG